LGSTLSFSVSRLGPADVALARQLNALFAAAFEDPDAYASRLPDNKYLGSVLAKQHVAILVATIGAEVIGGLVAYQLDKLEQARSEFYIYDLAVAAEWRRKGVATALIDNLRVVARTAGAWVIYVQGDYGDEPALALYDKLGVREEVLHFDIAP
jgi:aminoglycoside 3-N-acetyltransferase I